ncbi:DNA adenine methylase [Vallitalea guaymasensis]|uniref:DNA adenine methylase n=1 Tax=Vallitalea guaymasensis TaxID=1185412 RepID=UPI000DE2F691|nr:Dam family site-specific DNA-(adenine-N6)-methyltransferase [Vallitalea guaymasensis]
MNSFIGWIGGKNYLKKEITKRFPKEFSKYVEVFGGAGWVLFYKDEHAKTEIYNDFNSELVNLFKCIKYHRPEVQRELSFVLNSRQLFDEYKHNFNEGMTDIQRAARFFMLIKLSYGSNMSSYGIKKRNIIAMLDNMEKVEKRLSKVIIENKDFEKLIKQYDSKETLFYLDPPYMGTEKYYHVGFSLEDHIRLCDMLKQIEGKFILSYNNCEDIKELYQSFNIEEIERCHNLRNRYKDMDNVYKELLIMNY